MMIQIPSVPQYILESSFCLVVFYSIYYLLLRKDTFHQFNKYYLLSTALISVLLPFVDFNVVNSVQQVSETVDPLLQYRAEINQIQSGISNSQFYSVSIGDIVRGVFYIGVFLAALKFLYSLFQLLEKIKKNNKDRETDIQLNSKLSTTSLFNFLYWNSHNEKSQDYSKKSVVESDATKLRVWHSIDVIIMEVVVVLNWLNPLIYLYRKSIRKSSEYIIDEYVASSHGGRMSYAEKLMQNQTNSEPQQTNSNYTSMLDRILMLTKNRTSSLGKLKPFLVVPMTICMMALCSFDYADKLPEEIKTSIASLEGSIDEISNYNVLNLTHSKRNYEWEFRWGEHLYGLSSKDEDGNVKYDLSKDVSLYDLYESIENTPSYKTKGVYESMGFDIKITSNSDTVSNISVPIGDYDDLSEKVKKEIVKHKTPFSIYFSNIGSTNGKKDGGFMITVHQYLNTKVDGEEQPEIRKVEANWGGLDIAGSDMSWLSTSGHSRVFDRMTHFRYADKPYFVAKKDFVNKINDEFRLIVNDTEISTTESTYLNLSIAKSESVRSNISWNPATQKATVADGARTIRSISSVYHGRQFTRVEEDYDFKEMLGRGEEYIKDLLSGVTDGDVITITAIDTLDETENGSHFYFKMTIEDEDAAYKSPFEVELPSTSATFNNFQIYYNVEDDKTYVKVDTMASENENIVKAYRHSTSYQLMHVPGFKTKTRVNDARVLPSGILKIDPDMDLTVSVQRMERLNEHYTLSDRMIRLDWGRMISMPGMGNFSAKEFNRSCRSNILLSAGDNFLEVSRFDLVIFSEGREPTRIRTNNIKSVMCRQAFKELGGEASIYFDNIVINDNDEFKYYPYQFVFNVE